MTKPAHPDNGAAFDLAAIEREMRSEDAYQRTGHTARTLVREPDLRIVLIAMRAGARLAEHRTDETASVHALRGRLRLHLSGRTAELRAGALLVLEKGAPHDVEAIEEGALLLTLPWKGA
jgi:quercetin dioxygenase-like cupin family protein